MYQQPDRQSKSALINLHRQQIKDKIVMNLLLGNKSATSAKQIRESPASTQGTAWTISSMNKNMAARKHSSVHWQCLYTGMIL